MYFTRILLSIVFVLFASTALAAKPDKILVCHVGNELGSMGETYMDNPDCTIPPEWVGDPADYKCPDAGKIDLILVPTKAKHIGNEAHSFGDDSDYAPVLDDVGDDPADFEDNTSPPDGIDDGCETEELLACPCWTQADIESLPMDGTDATCTSNGSRLDIVQDGICEHSFSVTISPESALACVANRFGCPGLPDLGGEFIDTSESQFTVCLNQIINRCQELGLDPPEFP